ncbi:phage integrase N-terminal SAM-like domain-containing protein [Paucibacter sp. B2R-40]|uniref:phage integrase N-terminal SAM-like domain-containing protein n=1 Tax=Paucibacter sp. B2R-40 TaxID=2893554 RepID=UPI0021E37528|nr:phage integrase N-terminal SAM-like domain-containing protein [Paucibacter sp. B2R-40]MCV2355568.1 phage integrase N-terminal SAM-like domain-containing protein [Paucibacter sp. B2R-40]
MSTSASPTFGFSKVKVRRSLPPLLSSRLLDQVRERIRYLHYSDRTEEAYVHWILSYVRFHHKRHPAEMGQAEVVAYLTWLSNERKVAANTHRLALAALLFMYRDVLGQDLPWMFELDRPKINRRLTELLATTEDYILSLGDDVQRKELRIYAAFKRLKNFATIVLQKNRLLLYLHLKPKQLGPLPPNARDVGEIGHWGTGDLEVSLVAQADLDAVKPLIMMAYEGR